MVQEIDRTRRVSQLIQKELGALINIKVNDPRVCMVSVTAVECSRDLKQAKVFVSSLKSDAAHASNHSELIQGLDRASGFLRKELSHNINLRYTPALRFIYDSSIENGIAMSGLISKAMQKEAAQSDDMPSDEVENGNKKV